jgi:hypothetical protein
MANEFLVSVADAILRNSTTGAGIAYGKANISSAFTVSMQKTEVRGGKNNALLYTYYHDRLVEINIEEAIFTSDVLALNVGANVLNDSVTVLKTDCITLSSSGSGTLTETPTSSTVNVFLPDGTIQDITPTGTTITVSGGASQRVDAIYEYSETVDQITIDAATPPSVVDLTLLADVYNNAGVKTYELQINIPSFQINGNYTMNFAANAVSSQSLQGEALVVNAVDCSGGDYYAKVSWIPASTTTVAVSSIAATPSTIAFSQASLPATQNISVLGIRGGIYTNTDITTSCSFVKHAGGATAISVGLHTGTVTAGSSGSSTDVATIDVTYYDTTNGDLTDTVDISIGA